MLFFAGVISGAIGGMGIGGGIVLIPVLTSFFDIGQKEAQFINLIYFVPLALCALYIHKRAGRIELKKALPMALGGVFGALFGSELAEALSVDMLRKLFGIFLAFTAVSLFKKENSHG